MYYKVKITETARNNPKMDIDKDTVFNDFAKSFKTLEEVKEYLRERYGKTPNNKWQKIYRDPDGKQVGYLRCYWNKDWSHNSKSWWQTDWITISAVTEESILLKETSK